MPAGSTGEAPSLNEEEVKKIIKIVIKEANKEVPIVPGL